MPIKIKKVLLAIAECLAISAMLWFGFAGLLLIMLVQNHTFGSTISVISLFVVALLSCCVAMKVEITQKKYKMC